MNPLGLSDLDPKLVEAIKPLLLRVPHVASASSSTTTYGAPAPEWRAAAEQGKAIGPVRDVAMKWQGVLILLALPLGIIAPISIILFSLADLLNDRPGPFLPALVIPPAIVWTVFFWRLIQSTIKRVQRTTLQHYFTADILKALYPLLTLSPLESEYLDTIAAVLHEEKNLGTETARELITSLNSLLQAGRRLESEQAPLQMAKVVQTQVEAERNALEQRITTVSDAIARETFAESLALLEKRLARAQELAPIQERVEAQLSGIVQAMRSVQASVTSLGIVPGKTDLTEIQESARGLVQRTRAIEDAVQEVLRITH
ncbi:MAG: hypothetical protein QM758_04775 [Armatimonas sp.]